MNEGNNVADSSNENSAEECGKRCDRNINCNSFVFCNEQVGFATCSLKDKILIAAEKMNKSSNCFSYKLDDHYERYIHEFEAAWKDLGVSVTPKVNPILH